MVEIANLDDDGHGPHGMVCLCLDYDRHGPDGDWRPHCDERSLSCLLLPYVAFGDSPQQLSKPKVVRDKR